jgi:NMD protein affecting ribosome stability and mRNA decay
MTTAMKALRRDRLLQEMIHDPYKMKRKPVEPTICPECKALFYRGRWEWVDSWPADAREQTCQACRRIKDNYPAGVIELRGRFVAEHRTELIGLARHLEEKANAEHPLQRIMTIEESVDRMIIKTTDIHLPHRIADAVHKAYKGDLHQHYDEEGYFVRVTWNREN